MIATSLLAEAPVEAPIEAPIEALVETPVETPVEVSEARETPSIEEEKQVKFLTLTKK